MKKTLLSFLILLLANYSQANLPKKYVKIATSYDGNIFYGNTEDGYQKGSAWIVTNFKNGKSQIKKIRADCGRNQISSSSVVLYSQRNLKGKVLKSSKGLSYYFQDVIPDTIGEAQYNFACYGIY